MRIKCFGYGYIEVKAALISIFVLNLDQMIMSNVKGVVYSDNPTELSPDCSSPQLYGVF